jgi:hypothetical protein
MSPIARAPMQTAQIAHLGSALGLGAPGLATAASTSEADRPTLAPSRTSCLPALFDIGETPVSCATASRTLSLFRRKTLSRVNMKRSLADMNMELSSIKKMLSIPAREITGLQRRRGGSVPPRMAVKRQHSKSDQSKAAVQLIAIAADIANGKSTRQSKGAEDRCRQGVAFLVDLPIQFDT